MNKMHEIIVYRSNKKTGQLEYIHHWQFEIYPQIKAIGLVEEIDGQMRPMKPEKKALDIATTAIRNWVFKVAPSPVLTEEGKAIWQCSKFDDEDKQHIQRLFILEEL